MLLDKFLVEMLGMMFFVVVGTGAAVATSTTTNFNQPGWVLSVALTFGLAITTLAYTIGHISGAHINCAVTFGLVIAGACGIVEGLVIFTGQIIGSILGSAIVAGLFNKSNDGTGALGSNQVAKGFTQGNAFLGEAVLTGLLMFVVCEVAVRRRFDYKPAIKLDGVGFNGPLAIGLAVFIAHMVLIPIDGKLNIRTLSGVRDETICMNCAGCSINPTRSFGPLVMASARGLPDGSSHWEDFWVFVIGPLVGAGIAATIFLFTKVRI
mmetsp:Transcript_21792/g.42366  ORF Transcript_21792/g.42366 Transcript_21792/m.42366 type:complete len:266 (-) Transcript_21792:343-1140(-)